MPTYESWLEDDIILTTWEAPLTREEMDTCFREIAHWIDSNPGVTHVLGDITRAGKVPNSAPLSAIRSRFLTKRNTGRVAVIGLDAITQALAQVAISVTRKDIRFFADRESALDYLRGADVDK